MKKWLCLMAVLLFLFAGAGKVPVSAMSEIGGGMREIPGMALVRDDGGQKGSRPNGHRVGRNAPDLTKVNMSAANNNDQRPLQLLLLGLGAAFVMLSAALLVRRRTRAK
jgi:hypothetical protein